MYPTTQQNGVAKRKHRHILEITRALMKQSNLPLIYSGEVVNTLVYLINTLPSSKLGDQTPFYLLQGIGPTYGNLRVFGCLWFATNNDKNPNLMNNQGSILRVLSPKKEV